jgi:hypothetical protein
MTEPTILIQFDPETWMPTAIFYNGMTDKQTDTLREIADRMIGTIREGGNIHDDDIETD